MNSKLCKRCLHDDGLYGDHCIVCNCYDRWEPKNIPISVLLVCGVLLILSLIIVIGK